MNANSVQFRLFTAVLVSFLILIGAGVWIITHPDMSSASATFLLLGAGIVCLVGLIVFMRMQLSGPFAHLMSAVDMLREGDYRHSIAELPGDEFGVLSRTLERVRVFIGGTLDDLQVNSQHLTEASKQLDKMAVDISRTTVEQNDLTHQVATAIEQMEAASREVATNAVETSDTTKNAAELAKEGNGAMSIAQENMRRLVSETENTTVAISKLADESNKVGSVLDVIKGIAEQTNLLALNAAIEAARAGEQGRGFAVVADEVRSLAQKTQQSTVEIQTILENIQAGANDALVAMNTGKTQTEETSSKVETADQHLREIVNAVSIINERNAHIATAAEEQTAVARSLAELIDRINTLAKETSRESTDAEALSGKLNSLTNAFNQKLDQMTKR
ncbi:methyl-accepting chemotaxis protein [Aurantivibrio plasticivorans]